MKAIKYTLNGETEIYVPKHRLYIMKNRQFVEEEAEEGVINPRVGRHIDGKNKVEIDIPTETVKKILNKIAFEECIGEMLD